MVKPEKFDLLHLVYEFKAPSTAECFFFQNLHQEASLHLISFFFSNSGNWYMFLCIIPIPYKPRFKMQLTLPAGFLKVCPGAICKAIIMSELSDF